MAGDSGEIVACPDCGCVNERASILVAQANEQVALLERDLRGKRSRISELERDRSARLQSHKRHADAMIVLRHWRDVLAPKAREIDSPERLQAVIARLNGGHTVDELKRCADGYAKVPYVTSEGRRPTGTAKQWKGDAELIYRTPEHVRRGIAYYVSGNTPSSSPTQGSSTFSGSLERIPWRQVQMANRRLIVRALEERFGKGLEDGLGYEAWPCPRCNNDPATTLRIAPSGMTWLAQCSACGLDETRLIAAITGDTNARTAT